MSSTKYFFHKIDFQGFAAYAGQGMPTKRFHSLFTTKTMQNYQQSTSQYAKFQACFQQTTRYLFLCFFLLLLPHDLVAEQAEMPATFHWEIASLPQSDEILAVAWLTPAPGWHSYAHEPGSAYALPTTIKASLQNGEILPVFYPQGEPAIDPTSKENVRVYSGSTPFFIPVAQSAVHSPVQVQAQINLLLCSDKRCQPLNEILSFTLTPDMNLEEASNQPWWKIWLAAQQGKKEGAYSTTARIPDPSANIEFTPRFFAPELEINSLGKAAFFAFLAGLILNFMPCVLPVITLKLHSLLPAQQETYAGQIKTFRTHNLFFALGMLLYFTFLSVLIALTGMVWGQLFQNPATIITLTLIIFALGLSLFGLYDLPIIDLKKQKANPAASPALESFLAGILATLLATPCSGPFLGGVLAWSLLQPPLVITLVFFCIGLGMASPYLLLAARPSLARFMPKPGNWNIHLEQLLGFLLVATCVYLVSLVPGHLIIPTLILLWLTALGAWMWGKFTSLSQSAGKRLTIRGGITAMLILAALFLFRAKPEKNIWQPFQEDAFYQAVGRENIIVDFTADWCPNCKALEKTVLTPTLLAETRKRYSPLFFQVDLTHNEKNKMELLKKMGSQSIPVIALFSADEPAKPLILRDLFTKKQFLKALELTMQKEPSSVKKNGSLKKNQ